MSSVRTVSDTKRQFYTLHSRPISSIYRRIVEELIVEMHLLSVNVDFLYNAIYALGVVTTFDQFMQGYRPDQDKESIFQALCRSIESDPQRYRQDADQIKAEVSSLTKESFLSIISLDENAPEGTLKSFVRTITEADSFKYSRLFGIGLYTLLRTISPDLVTDKEQQEEILEVLSSKLPLPEDKLAKDVENYQLNLEKMMQAQEVLNDMLKADRKKREEREAQKNTQEQPVEGQTTDEEQVSAPPEG
ncbi:MAG: photosystem II biogenesis protein Psp29 [Leptolyngbyaceae bacterium]|nr:photosystem II biogenesis protein Psp29 [Leptolyngbyaceae bacterium]